MTIRVLSQSLQIVFALVITVFVLMQSHGKGLSSTINTGVFYRSRRGIERLVLVLTITFIVLFVSNALFLLFIT